jgi:hypothetical protein
MLNANYRRRYNKRDVKDETRVKFDMFKDKTKLFVALQDGQPIASQLYHYTPSTCQMAKLGSYYKDTGHASKLCIKVAIENACNAGYRFCDFGVTTVPSVAFFKSQFGPVQVPMGTYQKTYSVPRNRIHQASELMVALREDKMYLWNNRKKLLKKLVNARE